MATRFSRRAATARRKRRKRSQGPASRRRRQGRAGTAGGRLRPVGRQLHSWRAASDAGALGGFPQRRRGETRFARGRCRASAAGTTHWFAGEYPEARDSWNAPSPCFSPAGTTIWRFASDRTPASRNALLRACLMATRRRRTRGFPSRRAQARIARHHAYRHARIRKSSRPCSN